MFYLAPHFMSNLHFVWDQGPFASLTRSDFIILTRKTDGSQIQTCDPHYIMRGKTLLSGSMQKNYWVIFL